MKKRAVFKIVDGVLINYHGRGGDLVIPKRTRVIGKYAFCNQERIDSCITSITLQEGVECIEEGAFTNCRGTKSIILPNSLTTIKDVAFQRCYELTDIVMPDNPGFGAGSWFGDFGFPEGLEKSMNKIEPYMDDREFECNFIKSSMWDNLSVERKAYCYLNRRDRKVKSRYLKFVREEECDLLGCEILRQLPEKASVRETKAITAFLADFHQFCCDKTIIDLYDRIKNSKSSVMELESTIGFKDRMNYIHGHLTKISSKIGEETLLESNISDAGKLRERINRTQQGWKGILNYSKRKSGISITECLVNNAKVIYIPDSIGKVPISNFKKERFQKNLVVLCSYRVFKMLPAVNKINTVLKYIRGAKYFSDYEKAYLDPYIESRQLELLTMCLRKGDYKAAEVLLNMKELSAAKVEVLLSKGGLEQRAFLLEKMRHTKKAQCLGQI